MLGSVFTPVSLKTGLMKKGKMIKMKKRIWILVITLALSVGFISSCAASRTSETDELRKELDKVKKEREDEKLAKEKADLEKEKESLAKDQAAKKEETAKPKISAPVGATVAYCNSSNVVVRDSPSLQAKKVGSLNNREKVFVIEESNNYDEWKGTEANWAYIQKENGQRGWVFTPFISY